MVLSSAVMRPKAGRRAPPLPSAAPPSSNSHHGGKHNHHRKSGASSFYLKWFVVTVMLCAVSFYCGLALGMHGCHSHAPPATTTATLTTATTLTEKATDRVLDAVSSLTKTSRFPQSVQSFAVGMSRVSKPDFVKELDIGLPMDQKLENNNREVMILYNHKNAMPQSHKDDCLYSDKEIPLLTPTDALQNCHSLKLVLTGLGDRNQCMALMGNWEDYNVKKYMRLPEKGGSLSANHALRHVSQSHNDKNQPMRIPDPATTQHFWTTILQSYFANLSHTLSLIKPLASKVAVQNTVVVMVCNKGQSDLLMNFVCNAKARGIDTSQVLLFATDRETKDLAEGLGITVYYDTTLFGKTSSEAARRYGDKHFTDMMMAKVYCVQLLTMLGYHVLFQDADVIWFKNPVDFFLQQQDKYDLYFQDDGARTSRYAPYSPNTGFYFVRYNERSQYFFSSFLRSADMILLSGSHQSALNQVLAQHAAWRGLRVKVFSRDESDFPGGFTFHQRTGTWMKDFFQGKHDPYIFHMSWTANKENKILFFKQMGEWYLNPQCIDKTAEEILFQAKTTLSLTEACCAKEALFSCHYRDKPSKQPCKDSPPIDKDRPSFW